jgi:small subunit ribosomal protein S1
VHVSEISRRRVEKPDEVLKSGQQVDVKVLKVEDKGKRISLSMRELEADPWEGVAERFTAGGTFSGTVVRKSPFGLFVELEPGLEGLVHVSQLPLGKSMDDPAYAPGQAITGWVREVEADRRRLSLALREVAAGDPWKDAAEKYQEGVLVKGTVEKVTPTGVRILLEPGVEGFLPSGEMKLPKGNDPRRVFSPGKTVQVQVVGVETRRRRIALALEGSRVEGSRSDYQSYQRKQESDRGLGAMASAFRRLKRD